MRWLEESRRSKVEECEVSSSRYSIARVKLVFKGSATEIRMQCSVDRIKGPPKP